MIIWSGWGGLVALITFICALTTEWLVEMQTKDHNYYQREGWPFLVAMLVSAIIVWPLGKYLNRKEEPRELVDAQTGERVVLQAGGGSSLFFIPMEYWGFILASVGVGTYLWRLINS